MDENLIKYIRDQVGRGRSRSETISALVRLGWDPRVVDEHYRAACRGKAGAFKDKITGTTGALQGRLTSIVLFLGGALTTGGVISLAASNWGRVPAPLGVALMLGLMLGFYAPAVLLSARSRQPSAARAAYVGGTLAYGATLFVVARSLGLRANWSDGLALWMAGALILAMALESVTLYCLSIVLGGTVLVACPILVQTRFFAGNDPMLVLSTVVLALSTVVLFAGAWRLLWRREAYKATAGAGPGRL
jgi:uncharacterized membrane protein